MLWARMTRLCDATRRHCKQVGALLCLLGWMLRLAAELVAPCFAATLHAASWYVMIGHAMLCHAMPRHAVPHHAACHWLHGMHVTLRPASRHRMHAMARHAASCRDEEQTLLHASASAGGGRVRLAIIDHIISLAPVHLPVATLCTLCRCYGAAVLVDGAHAVGAVALDLPSLGADYYTSNLHK